MPPPGYTGRRAGLSNSYEPLNRRTPQQRDCSRLSPERRAFPFGGCPRLSRRARRAFRMDICHSALTRRCVFASLYARELWAGAMLCLAGFSSGRGACARGGRSAGAGRLSRGAVFVLCRSCDSIGMSCVCSRPSYVPFGMSCVRSRLLFAACAPNRTACGMFRSYSAVGRDRR